MLLLYIYQSSSQIVSARHIHNISSYSCRRGGASTLMPHFTLYEYSNNSSAAPSYSSQMMSARHVREHVRRESHYLVVMRHVAAAAGALQSGALTSHSQLLHRHVRFRVQLSVLLCQRICIYHLHLMRR